MDIKANEIKIVDIDDLVENPRNTNIHSEKQIGVLAKIIEKVGFRNPIVVSNRSGFIVTGHGRLEAAKLLDMKEVPVSYQDFENEAEEYKYLNADNEIARYAEFDKNKFLDNLKEMDFDIADIDFEEFGLIDFNFDILDEIEEKEKVEFDASQADKQFILEVKFSNEMEMMDIHDDLHHRGYIVKVKN